MYTINLVMEAINLYNQNKSYRKSSKILQNKYKLKITRQTIMNWNKWMNEDIDKFCKKRITANYYNNILLSKQKKFDIDVINDIMKIIELDPFVTRLHIKNMIIKKYDIKLSDKSISKIFKKLNLTRKKTRHYIVKSIDFLDKLIIKRNEFQKQISDIDIDKIISIDESGFNSLSNTNKGLSKKGKRINMPISDKKIKNKSLLCAITTNKIIHNEIHESGVNGIIFTNFIQNIIDKLTMPNYYFIFDNVPFHHNKLMLKLIIDKGHKYIFTPPYSPNNNPIEIVFGIIKSNFKKEYKEKNDKSKNVNIINLINNAINKFNTDYNKKSITKIFNHSIKYNYKDLEKELRDRLIIKQNNK